MKKLYIQPQTEVLRTATGEVIMGDLNIPGSPNGPEVGYNLPTRRANPVAVMYL